MKRQLKIFVLIILVIPLCLLHSCSSCTRTRDVTCTDGTMTILTVGYDIADLDSSLVVRYKPDNVFDSVVDSTRPVNCVHYSNDTLSFFATAPVSSSSQNADFFAGNYNYKIFLPSGTPITIANVVLSGRTHQVFTYSPAPVMDRAFICYNSILSCTVNGNTFTSADDVRAINVCAVK